MNMIAPRRHKRYRVAGTLPVVPRGDNPSRFQLLRVGSDRMEPTIRSFDHVIVDTEQTCYVGDDLYVHDGQVYRVRGDIDGTITLDADNAAYGPLKPIRPADLGPFDGRVVGILRILQADAFAGVLV